VCRFALDLLKTVRDFNGTGQHEPIDFRVGIATGSVVAGVVGLKRFLFDMWYVCKFVLIGVSFLPGLNLIHSLLSFGEGVMQ
jgi:hypothetical protein